MKRGHGRTFTSVSYQSQPPSTQNNFSVADDPEVITMVTTMRKGVMEGKRGRPRERARREERAAEERLGASSQKEGTWQNLLGIAMGL